MLKNKKNDNLVENFFNEKILYNNEKKNYIRMKIVICIITYIVIILVFIKSDPNSIANGIANEIWIAISIYLTLSVMNKGYYIALISNVVELIQSIGVFFLMDKQNALIGALSSLFTILAISIIQILFQRNYDQFKKVYKQKEKITMLYDELAASEDKLRKQNDKLTEYNQKILSDADKLNHIAYYDSLTNLPNRKMIMDKLDKLTGSLCKSEESFAVVFIDLDNFKKINDTLGHEYGDLLIKFVGLRINSLISDNDMLGRLGGDEFALIIHQNSNKDEIFKYVKLISERLKKPFCIERIELRTSACFGIAMFPDDGTDPYELIKCADTAMYKVKDTGKDGVKFFLKEMKDEIVHKTKLEKRLSEAIEKEEFFLAFQPQYNTYDNKLRGFEALIRWKSTDLGIISPMNFIPLTEEMGIIVKLGEWILKTACIKFKEIHDKYNVDVCVSVNISAIQINEQSFIEMIKNILEQTGLKPCYLELEITESVFIKSIDEVIEKLNKLKKMGIKISLDDFGTGYSSLSYLQRLPIDTLKIDKSFVESINERVVSKQIIGSIISLVHELDMFVIAEGVENEFQFEYLKKQKCDCIQGYLLGKPIDEIELEKLIIKKPV